MVNINIYFFAKPNGLLHYLFIDIDYGYELQFTIVFCKPSMSVRAPLSVLSKITATHNAVVCHVNCLA